MAVDWDGGTLGGLIIDLDKAERCNFAKPRNRPKLGWLDRGPGSASPLVLTPRPDFLQPRGRAEIDAYPHVEENQSN